MGIFGFKKGRSGKCNRSRRRRTDRLERIAEKELFDTAGKSQKVMASVLGEYCDIWVHDDDGMEAIGQKMSDIIYKGAERKILTSKRRELDNRITDIISRVIPGSNKPGGGPDKAGLLQDPKPDEKSSSSDVPRGYRISKRRFKDRPSLSTVLEGFASAAALSNLAGNQGRRGVVDSRGRIYVVRLGERMVEMTENDYRNYINRQKGMKKASPHNPGRLQSPLPAEKDDGPLEV